MGLIVPAFGGVAAKRRRPASTILGLVAAVLAGVAGFNEVKTGQHGFVLTRLAINRFLDH
jgi:hypothetical protein